MYADRAAAGSKRSVKKCLDGNLDEYHRPAIRPDLKRQRHVDEKWKHDLYGSDRDPPSSISRVVHQDLRLKLQKEVSQQNQNRKETGVRDLREKLSGIMYSHSTSTEVPKDRTALQSSIPAKKNATSVETSVQKAKENFIQADSKKKFKQKTESSLEGFLQSLELEKYIITFKVEEVDMAALMHITESDLKTLGIPMGPRKKILRALGLRP